MSPMPEPPRPDDLELMRLAESIADDTPRPVSADGASSPLLRHLEVIAEAAAAFRGAGPEPAAGGTPALFAWGPLEVRRALGEGSFGTVYAAWDPRLQREVALKLRHDDAGSARRWLDEARALARVRHPNVLTVHGADEHDGRVGMWTDLVVGRDLEAILQRHGPFSAREASAVGLELCAALAAVHARGLVHGDVKTRNVMRDEGDDSPGRIVLMDFGSAHDAALAMTAGRDASIGTPLAMAPEVLRGEPATPAADLYSLGVLLFRLATGRYPIEAATLDELRQKHAQRARASLRSLRPELPRGFVRAVEQALAPAPRERFADAAAFERALQAPDAARAATAARRPLTLAVAALAALAVVALLVVAPWRPRPRGGAGAGAAAPAGTTASTAIPSAPTRGSTASAGAALTVAPPAGSQVGLQAEATLYRTRAGEVVGLASGGEIEPGDRLHLLVASPEAVHAYVLDEDGAGHVVVLFPCAGAEERNPLAPGASHRLPGAGARRELNWLVTSAEGRETFLIVIARRPLEDLEHTVAALPQAGSAGGLQYAALDEDQLRRLRGVTRITHDPAPNTPADPGRLASLARALGARADATDLWIRLVQVENPKD